MQIEQMGVDKLKPYANNPRFNEGAVAKVARSIQEFGFKVPIVVDKDNVIVAGHTRLEASKLLKLDTVPVIRAMDLNDEQVQAFRLADNKVSEFAEWDFDKLASELDAIEDIEMDGFGFDDLADDFNPYDIPDDEKGSLADKFIVPPFSILDTKQGVWKDRKQAWLDLGIKSEVGREDNLVYSNAEFESNLMGGDKNGTSVFDPVLCEVAYKWFAPEGGHILDVFAGGSVRGVVAEQTGYSYTGVDLRVEQIEANIANADAIGCDLERINWVAGNSLHVKDLVADDYDLFFTCPPYHDLEVYSDDADDLSNMDYDEFVEMYSEIIVNGMALLKDNRFAVVVISDVRDAQGFYKDLVGVTKQAMADAGAHFYNDIILLNNIGTAPIRANRNMRTRKVVRLHQNVLVFYKGDTKQIKEHYPTIEYDEVEIDG